MPELEDQLRGLREEIAWPDTPDLAGAVAARLPQGPGPARGRRPRPRRRAVALTAAALLLVPAAGATAFPEARDDVLEWLGLRRTEVRRTAAPPAGRPPALPELGERVAGLGAAARRAGFRPLAPAALGAPDAVHVAATGAARRVTLVYRARPGLPALDGVRAGLLVTQVEGGLDRDLLRKVIGPGTDARPVRVAGNPGVLFTGAPHIYLYLDPAGAIVEDRSFLAGTVLVLERGGAVVRLEAAASPAALRRLAASLRVSG